METGVVEVVESPEEVKDIERPMGRERVGSSSGSPTYGWFKEIAKIFLNSLSTFPSCRNPIEN